MSITYAGFASTLAGLTISGVRTKLDEPPAILSSGNYPISYPRLPSAQRELISLSSDAGLKNVTCDLVVVMERDSLSTNPTKFADTIAMVDAIDTALATEMEANGQIDGWTITATADEFEWAVIATVEGSG